MATANIPSWTPCGSVSDGQYLYYGKTNIVTGTPISGTGWTLYTGAPLSNTTSSATITGLDDNVEYTFYIYCHCPTSGNGPLSNYGPVIKYVCPTVQSTIPTFNGVSYTLSVPASSNNTGSWIQTIVVQVYDSSGVNLLSTNVHNQPFASTISSSFTGLSASTNYQLKLSYSNSASSRSSACSSTPFTTAAACTAPTVTVSNITANSFDVSWTPSTGGSFDILVNNAVVASGLTTGLYTVTGLSAATIYQLNVRKNCTTGGTAVSTTQNITTVNALISGVISMNSDTNTVGGLSEGSLFLAFSFAQPTAFPMTLYFGFTNSPTGGSCSYSNGYLIFTPPVGAQNCSGIPIGDTYYGDGVPSSPFVVNIPQGVTTYNSGTQINTLTPSTHGHYWLNQSQYTDLYVKVNSPSGYNANFTIANGSNITGVNIHNR